MTERVSVTDSMRAVMAERAQPEVEPAQPESPIETPEAAASEIAPDTAPEPRIDATGRIHGPDGKFAPKEAKPEGEPEAVASETEAKPEGEPEAVASETEAKPEAEEAELGPLEPPNKWPLEQQQLFRKQPQEVQEWMLARDKEVSDAYQRKTTELAEQRQQFEPLNAIAQQRAADLQRYGATPAQYFAGLDRIYQDAMHRPAEFIQQFAQQTGVDLAQLAGVAQPDPQSDDDEYADPTITALKAEINGLKQQLGQVGNGFQTWQQQQQTMMAQQQAGSLAQQINAFASATDQAGNPLRPYFEEVVDDMVLHLHGIRAMGRQPTLQDLESAYNRAVWANDVTRAKLEAAREAQAARQRQEEARKHATAARKASTSITGSPAGSETPAPARDATEEFRRQYQKAMSAA